MFEHMKAYKYGVINVVHAKFVPKLNVRVDLNPASLFLYDIDIYW